MSLVIPRFSYHARTTAMLTKDSWHEIFDPVASESGKNSWHGHRKIARVRVAQRDGLYLPRGTIRGVFQEPGNYYRRVYGVLLYHIQHDLDQNVPFCDKIQLRVGHGMTFSGVVTTVTAYMTEDTRLSERTYYIDGADVSLGALIPVEDRDFDYGLHTTQAMQRWMYHSPPLKFTD